MKPRVGLRDSRRNLIDLGYWHRRHLFKNIQQQSFLTLCGFLGLTSEWKSTGLLIDHDEAELTRKEAIAAQKVDKDIDFDHVLVAMLAVGDR